MLSLASSQRGLLVAFPIGVEEQLLPGADWARFSPRLAVGLGQDCSPVGSRVSHGGPSLACRPMAASDVASGVFQLVVSRRAFFFQALSLGDHASRLFLVIRAQAFPPGI